MAITSGRPSRFRSARAKPFMPSRTSVMPPHMHALEKLPPPRRIAHRVAVGELFEHGSAIDRRQRGSGFRCGRRRRGSRSLPGGHITAELIGRDRAVLVRIGGGESSGIGNLVARQLPVTVAVESFEKSVKAAPGSGPW